MVPHRSTNQARTCLTSLSKREAVLSCWYGRSHHHRHIDSTITYNHCLPVQNNISPMSKIMSIHLGDIAYFLSPTEEDPPQLTRWRFRFVGTWSFDETQPVDITGPASGYTSAPLLQSGGIRSSRLFDNVGRGKQEYRTF